MKCIKGIAIIIGMMIGMSCGGGDTGPTLLEEAWAKFVAQDYAGAHADFSALINRNGADAYAGLGWTCMKMDSLTAADGYFSRAASLDSINVIAFAGWSIVGWTNGNYALSITRADLVLRKAPAFVFQYDNHVVQNTMVLTQAYDYFHLGDYQSCIDKIHVIDSGYSAPNISDPTIHTQLLTKLDALNAAQP